MLQLSTGCLRWVGANKSYLEAGSFCTHFVVAMTTHNFMQVLDSEFETRRRVRRLVELLAARVQQLMKPGSPPLRCWGCAQSTNTSSEPRHGTAITMPCMIDSSVMCKVMKAHVYGAEP